MRVCWYSEFAEEGTALTNQEESTQQHEADAQPVGYFYTWWRGDPLPELDPLEGFSMEATGDRALLAGISDLDEQEVSRRIESGHCPYLARVDGEPVAYGWSAWERAEIGELGVDIDLPAGDRYLWDFVTLPDQRGQGIYPLMLQEILRREMGDAKRFWIGHDRENVASAKGIERAGFPVIGEVWIQSGKPVFVPRGSTQRARIAAELLRLAVSAGE